ncbi:Acetyltransferase (GNAT) family, partial [Rhizoctonia solani]
MPKSQVPRSRKARAAKPKRKLHKFEELANKANKLSLEDLQDIFKDYLPPPKTPEGIEHEAKRQASRTRYITANDPDITWNPVQKMKELQHTKTRFVLVQNETALEAFCSFRFEAEEDWNGEMQFLVYIYEIQIAQGYRGTGLCRRIFTALEGMCAELDVQVVMLTCFKCNTQALPVYAHLGFQEVEGDSETSQEFWKPIGNRPA